MSPNASGDTTRPGRRPAGILNYQMPAHVRGHVASAPIEAGPATSPAPFVGLPQVEENSFHDHPVVVTASSAPMRTATSGQSTSLSLVDSLLESATQPPSAAEPSRGLPPSRASTPAPTLLGQSQNMELLLQEMRHQNDRHDQAMRSQPDVNQQLFKQLAVLSTRMDKTQASSFSTPPITEPPVPEDDCTSCIPPPRPGSLCRRSTASGACGFVKDAAQLDEGHCPDLARALDRTNEVLGALQREVSDLRTEVRAAPTVALARGSVPLAVRDRRRGRALVGPAPTKTIPSADMVADAIKAGLESESDSDDEERKPAPEKATPYSTGKMDDDARHFRTELDPVFGQPIRLGPKIAGLTPLRTSFSRFANVVHYAAYRLRRTEPVSDKSYEDNYKRKRRISSVMNHHCFDGVNPVSVLGFLRRLKFQSDLNNLTEGTVCPFLPDFLEEPARSEFLAYNDVGAGTGAMYSYPQAIQWLLNRYAKDRYLGPAIDQFGRARQRDDEEENAFALRLFKMAATFGGADREHDLISRFIRGLSSTLKPFLTAERAQAHFSDCKSYS